MVNLSFPPPKLSADKQENDVPFIFARFYLRIAKPATRGNVASVIDPTTPFYADYDELKLWRKIFYISSTKMHWQLEFLFYWIFCEITSVCKFPRLLEINILTIGTDSLIACAK